MQFDFGNNWKNFSANRLSDEKIIQARHDFKNLTKEISIEGKSFIDIGFGQGLSLLIATEMGANTMGCDINTTCAEVLAKNKQRFPNVTYAIPVIIGSILEKKTMEDIQKYIPSGGKGFDVVHSWGVLHHTGNMALAIENAASLVNKDGYLILALYNKHWTSPIWKVIKWLYCKLPQFLQWMLVKLMYPIIWLAKLIVTGQNPFRQKRGMDFYYDVIDWVGGYPYEYEGLPETITRMKKQGFECIKAIKAEVPTGCNEFVFIKKM